jgi:hypothetical protein
MNIFPYRLAAFVPKPAKQAVHSNRSKLDAPLYATQNFTIAQEQLILPRRMDIFWTYWVIFSTDTTLFFSLARCWLSLAMAYTFYEIARVYISHISNFLIL